MATLAFSLNCSTPLARRAMAMPSTTKELLRLPPCTCGTHHVLTLGCHGCGVPTWNTSAALVTRTLSTSNLLGTGGITCTQASVFTKLFRKTTWQLTSAEEPLRPAWQVALHSLTALKRWQSSRIWWASHQLWMDPEHDFCKSQHDLIESARAKGGVFKVSLIILEWLWRLWLSFFRVLKGRETAPCSSSHRPTKRLDPHAIPYPTNNRGA